MNISLRSPLLILALAALADRGLGLASQAPLQSIPADAADAPAAERLLQSSRAALGSEAALAAARFLWIEGQVEIEGVEGGGVFNEILAADGRAFLSTELDGLGAFDQGCDGKTYWEEDMRAGARTREEIQADIARRKYGCLRHREWSEMYLRAEFVADETIDGRDYHVLALIPNLGRADRWYIDVETRRLERLAMQLSAPNGEPIEFLTIFSDWREVDGVQYPFTRTVLAGETRLTRRVTLLRHESELSELYFRAPTNPTGGALLPGRLPRLHTLAPRAVASLRRSCRPQELGLMMGAAVREVSEALEGSGVSASGPPFTRYHALLPDSVDFEAGIPIAGEFVGTDSVHAGSLPGGEVVTLWHYGPVEAIAASYAKVEEALHAFRREPLGGHWEVYWTPPGRAEEGSVPLTMIAVPVRRMAGSPPSAQGESAHEEKGQR